MSDYLNKDIARTAIELMVPSIERVLGRRAKRFAGHLRVSRFEGPDWETLETYDFGERDKWEHKYEDHATAKEVISQRTGKSSREVQFLYPELVQIDDTVYYGSVISPGGTIVVTFSGVEAFFDELFAGMVLATCLALIQQQLEKQRDAGDEYFSYAGD